MNYKAFTTVVRDLVLLGTGAFGILHEEITGHFNVTALLLYAAAIGIPGVIGIQALSQQLGSPETPPTVLSPPVPPEPSSQPSSSS